MSKITNLIKEAEESADKWRSIVARGAWSQHNRTEMQAIILRERFEARLEAFQEAKLLTKVSKEHRSELSDILEFAIGTARCSIHKAGRDKHQLEYLEEILEISTKHFESIK